MRLPSCPALSFDMAFGDGWITVSTAMFLSAGGKGVKFRFENSYKKINVFLGSALKLTGHLGLASDKTGSKYKRAFYLKVSFSNILGQHLRAG